MEHGFISYAQNGEDVILWRALRHVRDGRYVDVGACEPDHLSVTKAFCERGWRGIDIEPVHEYADKLRAARPNNEIVQAAITDEDVDEIVLHEFEGTGLSTLDDKVARGQKTYEGQDVVVPARTLDDVCSASAILDGELHFLKVDVEGAEAAVLRSITLTKWRPWVVVVEATLPLTAVQSFVDWEPELTAAGYEFTLFDGVNRYYVSPDHPELTAALSYPACALDDFETARNAELVRLVSETRAEVVAAQSDVSAAQSEASAWRNLALGGFAESTSLAQTAEAEAMQLRKQVRKLEQTLEVTREKLFAVRRTNRQLVVKANQLQAHLEVRMRRKVGNLKRRIQGKS